MKRIIVEIEVTDSMYNAFGDCGEDADCEDCECRIGYDDCIFNHDIIDSKELLVILPVAPGETVYLIDNNTNACDECEKFHRGEHCDYCEKYNVLQDCFFPQCAEEPLCEKQFLEVIEYKTNQKWILENKDDFGKSIFLTREEAAAALKKMQEGEQ